MQSRLRSAWTSRHASIPKRHAQLAHGARACAAIRPLRVRSALSDNDVVALGNLCVDVVLPVDQLPPKDEKYRWNMLTELSASPPSKDSWEVGGNCNFMIAAARLGMRVSSVGHIGNDVYGNFLNGVLKSELVVKNEKIAPERHNSNLDNTLVCFVLVDPHHSHSFCSRYDFGPWPLLDGISELPPGAVQLLRDTKAVFTNGFVFDELPLEVVCKSCQEAIYHGAAVFFDPGPRCFTMMEGSRRAALEALMDLSTVVLMTEEEAKIVTGFDDPEKAARFVLARPNARTEWCVVKLGSKGALLCTKDDPQCHYSMGISVDVQDTVGCGDSFASAIVMGYVRKYSIPSTLALANAVGAATATGRGAGRNVASAVKVLDLLQTAVRERDGAHKQHTHEAFNLLTSSLSSLQSADL
mmetsp:Transcript_20261/g.44241  ORF Transcript_20261/g.44241 Transcript_20261/m.44241 type:complete len:412 (+) Transcript_20261:120-1355(+)|eukprot:CAMPEP_0202901894 /NCGR_PEP_ID=MMETSP1392-20130828/15225_1 /ASSEMBLY_ACC=CAM_ASM_000868 /TAXON_ID=225041 /ORGANISM="Chlamydomonas chlamydogama, Strain SAG 11-48b" /LENGTH=411 /DNA_ID=CAMNT_0049588547 /DNA_START=106 /DNA_END=1341 /DNA_ORIENTATION=+